MRLATAALNRSKLVLFSTLLAAASSLAPARAVEIAYVDDGGDCEGNAPCFTTVQAGVNNVSVMVGDQAEVRIFPGTYNESVDVGLMGSAIGGMLGDILLINESFRATLLAPPATSGTAAGLPPDLVAKADQARNKVAEWAAIGAPPPTVPNAAVIPVLIHSPGGPAIRTSVVPYPFDVVIVGIDVLSPNADGVSITGLGRLEYTFGNASGNGGNGVRLTGQGEVDVGFSTMNDNMGSGAVLESISESLMIINSVADRNMGFGFAVAAFESVTVIRTPVGNTPLAFLLDVVAGRENKLGGFTAQSSQQNVTVADIGVLAGLVTPTAIFFNDNQGDDGLSATADESIGIFGVQANRNAGNGVFANTDETVTMIGVEANGNEMHGIHVPAGGVLFFIAVAANDNDLSGILAQSNDITSEPVDPSLPLLSVIFVATSTDGNESVGTDVTASAGPIFIFAPTAIGNGVAGVRLIPAVGSQNRVEGGIICSNPVGLALLTNSFVDAEGNWWGSASGPFHATKNPGGTGNPVLDATNGGLAGDVDFIPWIDTVTGSVAAAPMATVLSPVAFQFSGGNGTVFLGAPLVLFGFETFGPGAVPPFTVSTDNGTIMTAIETGTSARTFLTEPQGIAKVDLIAFQTGPATVTITGPCGLAGTLAVEVVAGSQAPLLSGFGLLAALAALGGVAALALRRSAPSPRTFS